MNISLFTLRTFSATGGIEKVCRVAGKALFEYGFEFNSMVSVNSMHDSKRDAFGNTYFPSEIFSAWHGSKLHAVRGMVSRGAASDVVILSHINLLPTIYAIKKMSPRVKVAMFAHGIEVWNDLSSLKKKLLGQCDMFLAVSEFTRQKLIDLHKIGGEKIRVLNNPLDPFILPPVEEGKLLKKKLGIDESSKVIFTLTRLNSGEKYKGYDEVLKALSLMINSGHNIQYVIGGKYDEAEKERVMKMAAELQLQDRVLLTGFIPDGELPSFFNMADVYVMPSREEGFGIVFIEAMYYGLPVIAGNADGSADALKNGSLGKLVDPLNAREIADAIVAMLNDPTPFIIKPEVVKAHFGYESYKRKFNGFLNELAKAN